MSNNGIRELFSGDCEKVLALNENRFGGVLPNPFTNFSSQLTLLKAGTNQLVGNIPAGISNFVNLMSLDLSQNFLSGLFLSILESFKTCKEYI
ncbi:hypothetical protein Ddye_029537 [Dipteronia dyeriana]|uniref:Non-specific serine/threonine protein kinase n=1 Tax=Dipteronia dyeriana TaxID=168575 RepID=A0AAD9TEM9_9ROSI|nr:hypothetical protein Ddye_029537 [Dipteronia dyeriana]